MHHEIRACLIAGTLSGLAGLLVFLFIHHIWIRSIWFILPAGLLIASLGGLAVGWTYGEIRPALPPRPWTALAVFGLMAAILSPAVILGQILPPVVNVAGGKLAATTGELIARFVLLFVTAGAVGGLAGRLLAHTWRGAIATGVAGLAFAMGPGHNIPFFGNTPVVGKALVLLAAPALAAPVVLVETRAWLARRDPVEGASPRL